jgi:hypothetical protein
LERQLLQVLHRLLTVPPAPPTDGCRCLEIDGAAMPGTAPQSLLSTLGGKAMNTPTRLESFTVLTTAAGQCGCGCDCGSIPLTQVVVPQTTTQQEEVRIPLHTDKAADGTLR